MYLKKLLRGSLLHSMNRVEEFTAIALFSPYWNVGAQMHSSNDSSSFILHNYFIDLSNCQISVQSRHAKLCCNGIPFTFQKLGCWYKSKDLPER